MLSSTAILLIKANLVELVEQNLGSTYSRICRAPPLEEIVWQNLKSPVGGHFLNLTNLVIHIPQLYMWCYFLMFLAIFAVVSSFSLTPMALNSRMTPLVEALFDFVSMPMGFIRGGLESLIPTIFFYTFSLLTPYFIKVVIL